MREILYGPNERTIWHVSHPFLPLTCFSMAVSKEFGTSYSIVFLRRFCLVCLFHLRQIVAGQAHETFTCFPMLISIWSTSPVELQHLSYIIISLMRYFQWVQANPFRTHLVATCRISCQPPGSTKGACGAETNWLLYSHQTNFKACSRACIAKVSNYAAPHQLVCASSLGALTPVDHLVRQTHNLAKHANAPCE